MRVFGTQRRLTTGSGSTDDAVNAGEEKRHQGGGMEESKMHRGGQGGKSQLFLAISEVHDQERRVEIHHLAMFSPLGPRGCYIVKCRIAHAANRRVAARAIAARTSRIGTALSIRFEGVIAIEGQTLQTQASEVCFASGNTDTKLQLQTLKHLHAMRARAARGRDASRKALHAKFPFEVRAKSECHPLSPSRSHCINSHVAKDRKGDQVHPFDGWHGRAEEAGCEGARSGDGSSGGVGACAATETAAAKAATFVSPYARACACANTNLTK